jgi:diguanylate cyclase (GGDEF)-like protein
MARLVDPRLVEIDFLTDLDREGKLTILGCGAIVNFNIPPHNYDCYEGAGAQNRAEGPAKLYGTDPVRFLDMINGLLLEELISTKDGTRGVGHFRVETKFEFLVHITHAGRVHLWNIRDALLRNRLKDPTGILFDGRNAERDLQIALWRVSEQEPLAVAFIDMNGLKAINDSVGHDAGDEAVRAYFEVIAGILAEVGDAYRVGGDEVVILLPKKSLADGAKLLGLILRGVSNQTVVRKAQRFPLSACAGITAATDPGETAKVVRERADVVLYKAKDMAEEQTEQRFGKAKAHSKLAARRLGALAVDGGRRIEVFPPIVAAPVDAPKARPKRKAR